VNIFNLPKNFLPFLATFVHFEKKIMLKMFGFQLLESQKEIGHYCPSSFFLYKTIFNWLKFSPCLGLKPLESLEGWTLLSILYKVVENFEIPFYTKRNFAQSSLVNFLTFLLFYHRIRRGYLNPLPNPLSTGAN